MKPLIKPVSPDVLAQDLRPAFRVCSFRGLAVMVFRGEEAPAAMREIGRIREAAFRQVGAGRDVETDLDRRDFGPAAYCQLVVWDPIAREIVAAYRYICCGDHALEGTCAHLRTSDLFVYTDGFRRDILPNMIELGRSVVNKQSRRAALGLYATWVGLGALLCEYPEIDGFFGNFSVYKTLPPAVIDRMLHYLQCYHAPAEPLLGAKKKLAYAARNAGQAPIPGERRAQAYAALQDLCRDEGVGLPPILLSYLGAAPDMQYLGVAHDADFGDALECAILIRRDMLDPKIRSRFLDGYQSGNRGRFAQLRHRGIRA